MEYELLVLDSIQIQNFAIIDSLQLELEAGLTALTGETGAGKSILLDAIKLAAGDRADSDSIRDGAERAEISVCFNIDDQAPAGAWLADNEMSADDECVIRRVLYANGRSKAFINGYSATLAQLRSLCDLLIDIHGQHEHQSLQKPQVQRQLLDAFLGEPALLAEVAQKYQAYQALRQRLQQARSGSQEREQRIDLLELYCSELQQLDLADGEFDQLQQEYRRLSNAGKLLEKTGEVLEILYDNEEQNLQSALSLCEQRLRELLASDKTLGSSHEMVNAALIQVQEATTELRDYRDSIELDGERLQATNERIAGTQNLARKHHVEVAALPALRLELERELETLKGDSFDVSAIEAELEKAQEDFRFSARELSLKRRQTAASLSEQITQVMQQLGMEKGRFIIDVESGQVESANGIDNIRYLVSANPGQAPKPLSRVASGGELSRISLAIQVIMSESSQIPSLIFDEVDSGVGGGVAEIVGKKLRLLGQGRQVLCVTHLPQVASRAHHHFRVEKSSVEDDTTTTVLALDESERLEEIARMLGGLRITEQSRAHASEMIASRD
ncbi:MAG: DNA repair protein RecN [Gammaproteobacteria bacterium]|nr:MAG: DNA repair protein RecN [Gammaproteobacteria bacterium]